MNGLTVHGEDYYQCVHVFMYDKDENIPEAGCLMQIAHLIL